jgi:hypothetical protein
MTCQEFLDGFSSYLDGELESQEVLHWEQHMEQCATCARYDDVMRRGLTLVRELPEIQPSPDFQLRLNRKLWELEMEGGPDQRGPGLGTAISLAIAASLALIAWSPLLWHEPVRESTALAERGVLNAHGDAASVLPDATAHAEALPPLATRSVAGEASHVAQDLAMEAVDVNDAAGTRQWLLYSAGDTDLVTEFARPGGWRAPGPGYRPYSLEHVTPRSVGPLILIPGPYSPLIVSDPDFRARSRPGPVRAVSASAFD